MSSNEKIIYELLINLQQNNNAVLSRIAQNEKKIILEWENEENRKFFIEKLIDIILHTQCNLNLVNNFLHHTVCTEIYKEFKKSTVLIQACEEGTNINAIRWLLTMNIDPTIQDKEGRTALMLAAEKPGLIFVVKELIEYSSIVNITDNKGNTALFYSLHNKETLQLFINYASVDLKHVNNDQDTLLIYCCRYSDTFIDCLKTVLYKTKINVNAVNKEGRNALMYLVEHGEYKRVNDVAMKTELEYINKKPDGQFETLFSIIINKIYNQADHFEVPYMHEKYMKTFKILIRLKCNPNIPIDQAGNTPLMFCAMIEDMFTLVYFFQKNEEYNYKYVDFSVENKHGEDLLSICLPLNNHNLIKHLLNQPYFCSKDFHFRRLDNYDNTILIYFVVQNNLVLVKRVLQLNPTLLNAVNDKYESPLIIATKLGYYDILEFLSSIKSVKIDQQDYLGNSALYYAVELRDFIAIQYLCSQNASLNIKNRHGISP